MIIKSHDGGRLLSTTHSLSNITTIRSGSVEAVSTLFISSNSSSCELRRRMKSRHTARYRPGLQRKMSCGAWSSCGYNEGSDSENEEEKKEREAAEGVDESFLLLDGEACTLVSTLPATQRYSPRKLLALITQELDKQRVQGLTQMRKSLFFWQKSSREHEEEGLPSFESSAFEKKAVRQWTATELTLQHAQLSRIAKDVLYLVWACSLLGFVRVAEAVVATFASQPPAYRCLLDAGNSLDFFTIAFLAHSLRQPILGILRVDPINLPQVANLKAKIWSEMHKFYERQWKLVATLAVGRLLALVASTLPSTHTMTRNIKIFWDMLLALPIF